MANWVMGTVTAKGDPDRSRPCKGKKSSRYILWEYAVEMIMYTLCLISYIYSVHALHTIQHDINNFVMLPTNLTFTEHFHVKNVLFSCNHSYSNPHSFF